MFKQAVLIFAKVVATYLLVTTTSIFALSGIYSDTFDYRMSREEQARLNAVAGDLILGGALSVGAIAGAVAFVICGIELAYKLVKAREATKAVEAEKAHTKESAEAILRSTAPLDDGELLKAVAALEE